MRCGPRCRRNPAMAIVELPTQGRPTRAGDRDGTHGNTNRFRTGSGRNRHHPLNGTCPGNGGPGPSSLRHPQLRRPGSADNGVDTMAEDRPRRSRRGRSGWRGSSDGQLSQPPPTAHTGKSHTRRWLTAEVTPFAETGWPAATNGQCGRRLRASPALPSHGRRHYHEQAVDRLHTSTTTSPCLLTSPRRAP